MALVTVRDLKRVLCIAFAALALSAVAAAAAQAKPPPPTFFGVDAWSSPASSEFGRMHGGKVGVYRSFLYWASVESCRGCRDWGSVDAVIGDAARHHVRVLPFVWGTPSYIARDPKTLPISSAGLKAYKAFVRDLVRRYGTKGQFWKAHPQLPKTPLRGVQIWNEPSHPYFSNTSKASAYVKLLKAAAKAIRSTDPGMKVVLAGIPNVGGKKLVKYVKELYGVAGFRKAFDALALHPYAVNARAVFDVVKKVRSIMSSHRDGAKPIWITEAGWASNKGGYFSAGSPQAQAKILTQLYKGLIKRRKTSKIGMVVWFAWRDRQLSSGESDGWVTHTGLFEAGGTPKPAWPALVKLTGGKAGSGPLENTSPPPPCQGPPCCPSIVPGPLGTICPPR